MDIKQTILDSIKWTTETLGFTLVSEDWGNATHQCTCAMGCVLLKNDPKDVVLIEEERENSKKAAELLGVTEEWIDSFIDGFDGNGTAEMCKIPESWTMGYAVSKETAPVVYTDYLESLEEEDD
jgi:hypothetical protein